MMKDTFTTVVLGGTEISGGSGTIAVSKNGKLLLNVGPKADGTIPEEQRKPLMETGWK